MKDTLVSFYESTEYNSDLVVLVGGVRGGYKHCKTRAISMFDCRYSLVISVTLLLLVIISIDGFGIQQSLTKNHHKLSVSSLSLSASTSTAIEVNNSSKYLDEKQVCYYMLYYIYIIFVICFIYICDT